MAGIKDKVITLESLNVLHEHNKKAYVKKTDIIPMENGGTNSSNGAEGLKNLFANGQTIISSYQYGDVLPPAGNVGRIFFKKISQ